MNTLNPQKHQNISSSSSSNNDSTGDCYVLIDMALTSVISHVADR